MLYMRYKKNKILLCLMAFFVMAMFPLSAFAAQPVETYFVKEASVEIKLPQQLIAFSRNINQDDPNLDKLKLDKQTLEQKYINSNIYLHAISPDLAFEITLTVSKNSYTKKIYNLSTVSNRKLESVRKKHIEKNSTYSSCEIYNENSFKYLKSFFTTVENHLMTTSLDYYTIINGQSINLTFRSCNDVITDHQADFFESVINNINFTLIKPTPISPFKFLFWFFIAVSIAIACFISFLIYKFSVPYLKLKHGFKPTKTEKPVKKINSVFEPIKKETSIDNLPLNEINENPPEEINEKINNKTNIPKTVSNKNIDIQITYYDE